MFTDDASHDMDVDDAWVVEHHDENAESKKHVYMFVDDTVIVCTNKWSVDDKWYVRSTCRERFNHDYPAGGFDTVMAFLELECPRMEVIKDREGILERLSSLHKRGVTSWDAQLSPRAAAERALQHLESCC